MPPPTLNSEEPKKFALRLCFSAKARKSLPCELKTPQIRRFCACWASFFAEVPLWGPCRANFFAPTDIAPGLVGDAVPSKLEVVGVLHYMKP